jgi:magnesium transporter
MQLLHVGPEGATELAAPPDAAPPQGFIWLAMSRGEFEQCVPQVQQLLQSWTGGQLVDLHVSDLLNRQLPSHYDYTSWYDMLVFRRLLAAPMEAPQPDMLVPVDTQPVGFAVFDRVLLTVHTADGKVREHFMQRLLQTQGQSQDARGLSRLPASPSDLMLRMVNHIVDSYLDLRRLLSRQLGVLQGTLLDPKSHIHDWRTLLEARNALHLLEDTCEDQRSAVQEWIDALDELPSPDKPHALRERDLLRVRARDVLEHIERVLAHVRRLESSAETAVQMHFSAVGQRTNDIMRTLTVLTAIFLPLNLITGIFGMNFDVLPLVHRETGFWIAAGLMGLVAVGLGVFFWRKRYLSAHAQP